LGFGKLNHNKMMIQEPNTPGPSTTNHRVTTLLPPPTIIELGQSQEDGEGQEAGLDLKGSSQIMFHSGFINHMHRRTSIMPIIHEAVFATAFSLPPPPSVGVDINSNTTQADIQRLTQWQDFTASILFSILFIIGCQISRWNSSVAVLISSAEQGG
jgi:hypothetical protein